MSFGGISVDARRATDLVPGASLLTGLLANALGYEHREVVKLQRLQVRLRLGVRCDQRGARLTDYQTVDLGQEHLVGAGWTTAGRLEGRGGAFSTGTHIRHREFIADASYLVAVALEPADEDPTVEQLAVAVDAPARPLFLGRKACIPATRLFAGLVDVSDLEEALLTAPPRAGQDAGAEVDVWVAARSGTLDGHTSWTSDERDWRNQVHTGRRLIRHERHSLRGSNDA